jgi:ligand-binding sensor domain-containing protein
MLLTRFQLYGLFILVSCVCLLTDGKAQTADAYKFESLGVNEGLSHGQVNSVLKDSRGFLWIGTAAGLNLYDGYTVKTFTYDPRDSSSINATDVIDLFEGPEGNIWVVTANGLTIYNPSIEQFIHELDTFQRKYSLPSMAVSDIISAPVGIVISL